MDKDRSSQKPFVQKRENMTRVEYKWIGAAERRRGVNVFGGVDREREREWIINEVNFKNKIKLVHLNKLIISKRRKQKRTSNRGRRSAIKMHKQQNCSTHILRGGCVCVLILLRWTLEEEKERERTKKRRRYLLHMHSFFRDKASECV